MNDDPCTHDTLVRRSDVKQENSLYECANTVCGEEFEVTPEQ